MRVGHRFPPNPSMSTPVRFATAVLLLLASSCVPQGSGAAPDPAPAFLPGESLLRHGVAAMGEGRVEQARGDFRQVLKYDPRNARAHLALATTFEADALGGDTQKRDLAEVGYQQALLFDPRSWLAAYRLGVLEIDAGHYPASIEHLSRAAILNRREPAIFGQLARALYMQGMFPSAQAVVEHALAAAPNDPALLQNAAIIAAADGDSAQAVEWSRQYRLQSRDPQSIALLDRRLDDWRLEHARSARVDSAASRVGNASPRRTAADTMKGMPAAMRSPFLVPGSTEAKSTMLVPLPSLPAGATARMVQIDVTLIRTQEIESSSRGVNLLAGLRANFGTAAGETSPTTASAVLRTLRIPEISYSLDIANTGYDRSDVLARPLLIALDGQPANFFVGEELSIPVSVGGLSPGSLVDRSIGTEIAITPTFLDDNTVLLSVSASRSFVATNFQPDANRPVRQTVQRVTTAVVSDFDQSVILSGLSEHELHRVKSGVPVLGELPVIQNLFSTKSEQLYETSVLIVLSPHRVGQTRPASSPSEGTIEVVGLTQLSDYFPQLVNRIGILQQLSRTLEHTGFRALLSLEDVVAIQRSERDSFTGRMAKQLRDLFAY